MKHQYFHPARQLAINAAGDETTDMSIKSSDALPQIAGKRLLVVEEALKTHSGHWFEYVRSVVELNKAAGVDAVVVSHVDTDPGIQRELSAHPIFAWTNWDGIYNDPRAWKRYVGIARHNLRVYRTMNRFIKRHGPFDLLFAPTVVIHQVIGWRLLMARHGGRRIGRMVLLFRNNAGRYPENSATPVFKRSTAILKWALRSFIPDLKKRTVRLVTDSKRLADEYRHLCGIEPEVFPSPRVSPPPSGRPPECNVDRPLTFSCLGPARFEKGIDILQDAIRAFFRAYPGAHVRFVIQWSGDIIDETGSFYQPDAELAADRRVTFVRAPLDSAQYDAALAATDCMLLPYRRDSYFARISGVAVEAVTAGIPVIYTRGTWCEDLVEASGSGLGMRDGDANDLARCIGEMVDGYGPFRRLAEARAAEARRRHSGHAFLKMLWTSG
jgi:glycosyltransferase involved in cell wall biosynthesis